MNKTPEQLAKKWAIDWHKDCDYPDAILEIRQEATKHIFLAGYKAAQAIVEEELQAVQAQRVEHPGLGSAEYALKSVLAKMGSK